MSRAVTGVIPPPVWARLRRAAKIADGAKRIFASHSAGKQVSGIILAGGESRRMAPPPVASAEGGSARSAGPLRPASGGGVGRNKAFLPWGDRTLIEHMIDTLRPVTDEIIVVVKDASLFAHLHARVVEDLVLGAHALGGLYTGLSLAAQERCFICACDAPLLNPALILFLTEQADGCDLVIPRTRDGLQPLHAVYCKSVLPAIEEQLRRQQWDLRALVPKVRARIIGPEQIARFDPEARSFFNVNTPEDYATARSLSS